MVAALNMRREIESGIVDSWDRESGESVGCAIECMVPLWRRPLAGFQRREGIGCANRRQKGQPGIPGIGLSATDVGWIRLVKACLKDSRWEAISFWSITRTGTFVMERLRCLRSWPGSSIGWGGVPLCAAFGRGRISPVLGPARASAPVPSN